MNLCEIVCALCKALECKCQDVPVPPVPPEPPAPPSPFGSWWDHRNETKGVVAFPLSIREGSYIRDVCQYVKEHGYNTLSCGAQAWQKDDAPPVLPRGPKPGTQEWRLNLERLLTITAEEKVWLVLNPTFGLKHAGGQNPYEYHRTLCEEVVDVVDGLGVEHLSFNVMNEFIHQLTNDYLKDEHIRFLGEELMEETGLPVSSDAPGEIKWLPDHAGERWIWKGRYPDIWQQVFTHLAFHPPRNVRKKNHKYAYKRWPNAEDYDRVAKRWSGKTKLYNETTKYASDAEIERWNLKGSDNVALSGTGTEEERQAVILEVKENIKAAKDRDGVHRSRFFYHSQCFSIRCDPAEPLGWIPGF